MSTRSWVAVIVGTGVMCGVLGFVAGIYHVGRVIYGPH